MINKYSLIFLLFGMASFLFGQETALHQYFSHVEKRGVSLNTDEIKEITSMDIANDKIYLGIDYSYILVLNKFGSKLFQFGRDKYRTLRSWYLTAVSNGDILTTDNVFGKLYLSVYDKKVV